MGLFGMFKKKTIGNDEIGDLDTLKEFERALVQEATITMFQLKITKQPALNFFQ